MIIGLFLLLYVIVKIITQYKYNKFYSKKENTVIKYRKIPFGIKDNLYLSVLQTPIYTQFRKKKINIY